MKAPMLVIATLCVCSLADARQATAADSFNIQAIAQDLDHNASRFAKDLEAFKDEDEYGALKSNMFEVQLLATSINNRSDNVDYVRNRVKDLEKVVAPIKKDLTALQGRIGEKATLPLVLGYGAIARGVQELKAEVK